MMTIRKADQRGHADHGWLDTYHTFSFAHYYDPKNMGFGPLRVINDDKVAPGQGFGMHGHNDMEILTWVLKGQLEHKDSMGNHGIIEPGELQRMSAGTGVRHSEFNASDKEWVHLLQIWIMPEKNGITPSYEQTAFPAAERDGALQLIASRTPPAGSKAVTIHQNANVYAAELHAGQKVEHTLAPERRAWVHVAFGDVEVNGNKLSAGDSLAVEKEQTLSLAGVTPASAQVLVFDLQ